MKNHQYKSSQRLYHLLLFCVAVMVGQACTKTESPEPDPNPPSPPAQVMATGTLHGSNDSCLGNFVQGTYKADSALSAANYIKVIVNVTGTGHYAISTDTVNGIYFRDTGSFLKTGLDTLSLPARGKPEQPGTYGYTVTYGSSACNFQVSVYAGNNINNNGTVFIATVYYKMYALDAQTGALKWTFDSSGGNLYQSPTVSNGFIYFGSSSRSLFCVNAFTGIMRWHFYTGPDGYGAPIYTTPLLYNGHVYFTCDDNKLYALDTAGVVINNFEVPVQYWTAGSGMLYSGQSNTAAGDGIVYNGTYAPDFGIYANDAATGALLWKYPNFSMSGNPAVYNKTLYTGSDRSFRALDGATGALRWEYLTDKGYQVSSPTVFDGMVYTVIDGGYGSGMIALNTADGTEKWNAYDSASPDTYYGCGPIVENKTVYYGSENGALYARDAYTGKLKWKAQIDGSAAYPVFADNNLYIGGGDHLWVLDAATGRLKWTAYVRNAQIPCVVDVAGRVHHGGQSGEEN